MIQDVFLDHSTYAAPPLRFEAGTPSIAEAIGLGAACDYLLEQGMENIRAFENELGGYLHQEVRCCSALMGLGPTSGAAASWRPDDTVRMHGKAGTGVSVVMPQTCYSGAMHAFGLRFWGFKVRRLIHRAQHPLPPPLQLARVDGVRIYGPPHAAPNGRAALASFNVKGIHPSDISTILDQSGVAVRSGHLCTQPLHRELGISASVRASPYFYNTTGEIDVFIEALEDAISFFS